jgi:hypothetical protein
MNTKLFLALSKLAGQKIPEPHNQEFLDEHFSLSPKWKEFQKKLRSKNFVQAVTQDDRANKKLKRFSESIGRHKQAKGVPVYDVPSQSSGRVYTVKYHPDIDRFSCNCGDWTYARSWRIGQRTRDCKHVQMVNRELKAQVQSG